MRRFGVSGHWANAQVTAADLALFFYACASCCRAGTAGQGFVCWRQSRGSRAGACRERRAIAGACTSRVAGVKPGAGAGPPGRLAPGSRPEARDRGSHRWTAIARVRHSHRAGNCRPPARALSGRHAAGLGLHSPVMRSARVVAGIALLVTLCAAEVAQASSPAVLCDPVGAESLLPGSLPASSGAVGRGGQQREPDLGEVHATSRLRQGRAGKASRRRCPCTSTWSPTGPSGGSPRPRSTRRSRSSTGPTPAAEGGAASGFSFQLAGVTRTDNADWFYANPGGVAEHSMKDTLRQGGTNALNYYSTTAGDFLGWSYLPEITTSRARPTSTASWWTGSRCWARRRPIRRVRPGRDGHARGGPLARPRAHLLPRLQPRATSWRTPAGEDADVTDARPARTPAGPRASTRSTTTWTTRSTAATRSSPPGRCSGCAMPCSCTAVRRSM